MIPVAATFRLRYFHGISSYISQAKACGYKENIIMTNPLSYSAAVNYGISGDSALASRISSGTFIKFDEDTCDSSEVKTSRWFWLR